ncbi:DUF4296 domain-containing protein [Aquimarina sp. I32.4]|uniref:DUF4296 domain-containing protein n=1 Tax=Aquimarina sp. I32.4 TaxID=2053903 RepID=UPI000CDF2B51|nr:DUF4296 domain-containing protein [Aquimarina sp. I32.4]
MSKYVTYISIFLIIISCQSVDRPPMPETLVGEDCMVDIFTDIAFVKAAKSSHRKKFEEKNINPQAYILQKHGVDSVVFAQNNAWYSSQFDEYKAIFARVKVNLEEGVTLYEKLKKEEDSIKKRQDSIAKIKDSLKLKEKPVLLSKREKNN